VPLSSVSSVKDVPVTVIIVPSNSSSSSSSSSSANATPIRPASPEPRTLRKPLSSKTS